MNRNYSFSLVSYANLSEIQPLLNASKHYCYILHDNDVNEDNTPRSPHYHILCTFEKNQSYKQVSGLVQSTQNTFVEGMQSVKDSYDYLTHDTPNSASKYHYDSSLIVHDDIDYWARRVEAARDVAVTQKRITADELVDDLISKDFSVIAMGRKYGRDFIKNCNSYLLFRKLAVSEILKNHININVDGEVDDTEAVQEGQNYEYFDN